MSQQRIGRYQVLEDIAVGGQGAVYKAIDPLIDRIVAIKVLKPELTSDGGYLERFYREAALAAQIDHPNVVKIYDMGEDDGRHFIVMEYLPRTLADLIPDDKGLPIDRVLELGGQIAEGLAAAHARGITHRDVKPQNVLITQDGDAKVTDFGIARAEALSTMTATGMIMGTPHYMSPEQAQGNRADVRSDVYSLGCVMYQMLAGEVPFQGTTPMVVLRRHIDEEPRPIRELRRDVPRELTEVVERAMEKDPDDRYQSASDIAEAIESVTAGTGRGSDEPGKPKTPVAPETQPRRSKRPLAILGVASTIVALAIVIAAVVQSNGSTPRLASEPPQQPTAAVPAAPSSPATPVAPIPAAPAAPAPSLPAAAPLVSAATPATTFAAVPAPAFIGASPSGKIAFASNRHGEFDIFVMEIDGSNQVRLTDDPIHDGQPRWSPDGGKISFVSKRDGNVEIYVMDADGSHQVRLTNNPANDRQASWSPDGGKISFVSTRDGNSEIYVMNADGSNPVRLTNDSRFNWLPSWSPDGSKIVFESRLNGIYDIYVMNPDGSNQINLTDDSTNDSLFNGSPSWSPDGSKIAFMSRRDGNSEIYVMNFDGSNPVRLTNSPAFDWLPSWSLDGSKIAFASDRLGNREIYVMDADGSNQINLSNNRFDDDQPSWGPVTSAVDSVTTSASPAPTNSPTPIPTLTPPRLTPTSIPVTPLSTPIPLYVEIADLGGEDLINGLAMKNPEGVDVDSSGNIYVADTGNNRVVIFDSDHNFVRELGIGPGQPVLIAPRDVAVDDSGNIYVASSGNDRVVVFDSSYEFVANMTPVGKTLNSPSGIAAGSGLVIVTSAGNDSVFAFDSRRVYLTELSFLGSQFNAPWGVTIDSEGNTIIIDSGSQRIFTFDSRLQPTVMWGGSGSEDGRFRAPLGVATDVLGNIFVTDRGEQQVQVFETGAVRPEFVGRWGSGGTGEGQFLSPIGIATDSAGLVYVVDRATNSLKIFRHK